MAPKISYGLILFWAIKLLVASYDPYFKVRNHKTEYNSILNFYHSHCVTNGVTYFSFSLQCHLFHWNILNSCFMPSPLVFVFVCWNTTKHGELENSSGFHCRRQPTSVARLLGLFVSRVGLTPSHSCWIMLLNESVQFMLPLMWHYCRLYSWKLFRPCQFCLFGNLWRRHLWVYTISAFLLSRPQRKGRCQMSLFHFGLAKFVSDIKVIILV